MEDQEVIDFNPKGIHSAGGPESVPEQVLPRAQKPVFTWGVPVSWYLLRLCKTMQSVWVAKSRVRGS